MDLPLGRSYHDAICGLFVASMYFMKPQKQVPSASRSKPISRVEPVCSFIFNFLGKNVETSYMF